jgi:4-amino-4-deoxy-L-arabinose transferase-like glycosyltransferase
MAGTTSVVQFIKHLIGNTMPASNLFSKIQNSLPERRKLMVPGLLVLVLLLGAFLRFYQLGAGGVGNTYYAATVKSMLVSWHNFFFAAFEPGGSLSVDKPPLGFWVQALSAYFLGVTGFALALPNACAGILSIFLVYHLVRRPFGAWAGLAAALALAVMPVAISTERNNTIDGLLVCVLLLAAWAFLQAVYTGKPGWLLLGACIVGLGFNIKMLQAFLPLPAFYAVYFFGAKHKWWQKLLHLGAATLLLLVVSFSWAVVVDLVPAAERPYVDSTSKNSVMELIFGHNGIERLTNLRQQIGLDGGQDGLFGPAGADRNPPQNAPTGQNLPPGSALEGNRPQPPAGQGFAPNPGGGPGQSSSGPDRTGPGATGGQPGGPGGSMDFGSAGTLRLFSQPLAGEASWLLPFGLGGLVLLALVLWKRPFDEKHAALILWAGWLLPEVIYFTYSSGLMHAYYLIMLGAPLAALAGMSAWACWQVIRKQPLPGWGLVCLLTAGTLVFQGFSLWGQTGLAAWAIGIAALVFGLGLCLLGLSMLKAGFAPLAFSLLLVSMLVAPALWSALTTFNPAPNGGLPSAGPSTQAAPGGMSGPRSQPDGMGGSDNTVLLNYLITNTRPGTYLLATDRASEAAPYILATGRPVLAFGGFLGQYNEVSVDQLAALVKSGQLRFVLSQGQPGNQEMAQWVQKNCSQVTISGSAYSGSQPGGRQFQALYDCGG